MSNYETFSGLVVWTMEKMLESLVDNRSDAQSNNFQGRRESS